MTDDELVSTLTSLEAPLAPGDDVDAEVLRRISTVLAAGEPERVDDDVPLRTTYDDGRRHRAARLAVVAAAGLAVVGGVVLVTSSDSAPVTPADTAVAPAPPEPTPPSATETTAATPVSTSAAVEPTELPRNVLGYQVFTSAGFSIGAPPVPPESEGPDGIVLERVGDVVMGPEGFVADVRRTIGPDVFDLQVVVRPDGSAIVPIEFIDPSSLGGRCVGGAIEIGLDPPSRQRTPGACDGTLTDVRVDAAVTDPAAAPIDGDGDRYVLVTYTITTDIDPRTTRIVTLWHTDGDLERLVPGGIGPSTIEQESP